MGLTFADIQSLSREESALYPVRLLVLRMLLLRRAVTQPLEPLPLLTEYNDEEKRIAELQIGFATRLRKSAYYIVETTKSTGKLYNRSTLFAD